MYCFLSQGKRDRGELSKSVKEVVGEADRLEVKEKVPLVLVELLLTDKILTQIKEHRILFLSVSSKPINLLINLKTKKLTHVHSGKGLHKNKSKKFGN